MRQRALICPLLLMLAAQTVSAVTAPRAASPGRTDDVAGIEARCPTFSWSSVPDAEAFELVV